MLPDVDALFTLVRELARHERVTDIAAPKSLVQRHGLAAMSARAGAASYREDLARATLEWARIERELPLVVSALRGAGARVAPIKGAAYAKTLYGVPAERPMGDVDLLVRPEDLPTAERVLHELGFLPGPAPAMHHAHAWVRGDLAIDVHRNIIAPGRSRIDLATVWARTTPGWPDGAEWLEANDALVFHLVHFARNRLRLPLVNVIDTARLLQTVNGPSIALERARAWGLGRAVELALRFATAVIESEEQRPIGWLGPSRDEIAQLTQPGTARKILFDAAISGSPVQLAFRALHFSANQARRVMRRTG